MRITAAFLISKWIEITWFIYSSIECDRNTDVVLNPSPASDVYMRSKIYHINNKYSFYIGFNPYLAEEIYLNFQPLEVVSRYRDPQPQVVENYS